ncbi:Mitogen-activated protein kinase kinase kinase 3 [Durusdinium trenchii]|uniref:Mitogen-activated protein kinase kinase kinase 3 n=1 Tax=Durusdinium trenchii TaxID=1381693 RepID=A0ABP0PE15_9DINO
MREPSSYQVRHPYDQRWDVLGLPGAFDFTYLRKNEVAGQTEVVVTRWGWVEDASIVEVDKAGQAREEHRAEKVSPPGMLPVHGSNELLVSRVLEVAIARPRVLMGRVRGKTTDWAKARRAAEMIRSPEYTTKELEHQSAGRDHLPTDFGPDFYEDMVAAFPELRLYSVVRVSEVRRNDHNLVMSTSANRSGADEFQRTTGALFCIFWLMRQHLDGRECFCFGLDHEWKNAKEIMRHVPGKEAEFQRRMSFYEQANWSAIEDLMRGAGLLTKQGHDVERTGTGGREGGKVACFRMLSFREFGRRLERTLAMLVLMTIHDIMKLDILRPTVLMNEFCGYKSGEVIGDHDIALSYVLERCPEALPSFAGLLPELQECIRFTHCKLDYNMGWLVQGEAHPGALFRAFRQVILERPKETSSKDVAFYFVHWFADLAGAEASPLTGCEKFVLKFPLHVLSSFIDSFPVVWKLGPLTETQVFEEYLIWRWENMPTSLGVRPSGTGAVAQMRLVLMAQGDSVEILRQFKQLPKSDANILTKDGTFRGCPGQSYSCDDSREVRGPAILVYYAPALMQKAGRKNPYGALRILAEVFRQARALWPLSDSDAEKTVLLRIDVLKATPSVRSLHRASRRMRGS